MDVNLLKVFIPPVFPAQASQSSKGSFRTPYICFNSHLLLQWGCKSWQWRDLLGRKAPEWQLITFASVSQYYTFLIPFSFYHCYSILFFFIKRPCWSVDGSYFFFFALKCQSLHGQLPNFDIFPPKTQRLFIQPSIPQTEKHSPDWAEIAAEKKLENHKELEIKLLNLVYILFIVQDTLF